MSVCSVGTPTQLIPVCVTNLTLGAISSVDTAVLVFFHDITTGMLFSFEVTTDGTGKVIIVPTEDFMPDHSYDVWVALKSAVSIETKEDLTIEGLVGTTDTVTLRFTYVRMNLGFTAITVTAE